MARYTANNKTLEWGRAKGWQMERVEQFNSFSGYKTDLLHIIDYLGITKDTTNGVQICGADFNPHVLKIMIDERANTKLWLSGKGRTLVLIGWRKVKEKRGGKRMVYRPRVAWFTLNGGKLSYVEE